MNYKLVSWNVNGVRAVAKKDFFKSLSLLDPDVLCLQETKAQDDQVAEVLIDTKYVVNSNSADRKGYSGTATLSKTLPLSVSSDLGIEEHDQEGRVLCTEFEHFFLVNVYVPNSGNGLKRLAYRQTWDTALLNYVKRLEKKKPVVLCGDLNVCHQPIDIARPTANYNKTSGYTQIEIDGLSAFLSAGFVDTFRHFHPDTVKYSWWSYRMGAREKNIGWRLDYFLISKTLLGNVQNAEILNDVFDSDHCPVSLTLSF